MTPEQKEHKDGLNSKFTALNDAKYEAGAKEHQGNLWGLSVLQLAFAKREEVLDQWNYNETQIDNLLKMAQAILELIKELESVDNPTPLQRRHLSRLTEIYDSLVGKTQG